MVVKINNRTPRHYRNQSGDVKQWTMDEDNYVISHHGRTSIKAIAADLGRTTSAVCSRAFHLGLCKSRSDRPHPFVKEGICFIPLSSRKYPGLYAIIDVCDMDTVSKYSWSPHKAGKKMYTIAFVKGSDPSRTIYMHQLICEANEVDHADGDGLNNCRYNLRVCTRSQNSASKLKKSGCSSKYKGVSYHRQRGKWVASLCDKYLGIFHKEVDAALAYDHAAKEKFGEFARLNFPHSEVEVTNGPSIL